RRVPAFCRPAEGAGGAARLPRRAVWARNDRRLEVARVARRLARFRGAAAHGALRPRLWALVAAQLRAARGGAANRDPLRRRRSLRPCGARAARRHGGRLTPVSPLEERKAR